MDDVFSEVNNLSAEQILSRINLPPANDGKSYVCPSCDNGTGKTGDGIKPRLSKGLVRWKCFRCGKDFSNFDLVVATMGLDAEIDKAESIRRAKELFGLNDSTGFSSSRDKFQSARTGANNMVKNDSNSAAVQSAEMPSKPKEYVSFYGYCRRQLDDFMRDNGSSFRGLTAETLHKYGVGYHPNFGVEGKQKQPHLIFPYDDYHYFARAITGHDRSQHGTNSGLYAPQPINSDDDVFIVEGEIDCLSVLQAVGKAKINCIATGSATNYKKVVPELNKRFANAKRKPKFIVMFDNDETGQENSKKLIDELDKAGYDVGSSFLPAGQDANSLLQTDSDELSNFLTGVFKFFYDSLENAVTDESPEPVAKVETQEQSQPAEDTNLFSFAGYFANYFYDDVKLTAKYANRKTGFDNLDAVQIFMPGLYVLGALPATGKTTFAWQLLEQLARQGEKCVYCSYEMGKAELFAKSLSRAMFQADKDLSERLNLSSDNIRRGAMIDIPELKAQVENFMHSAIDLNVLQLSSVDIDSLISNEFKKVMDTDKPPVICLDYLQLIPPSKGIKTNSTKERVDNVVFKLKDFQRATNATIIAISSFNRQNYAQQVAFESFKESGAIEYTADVVWGLENFGIDGRGEYSRDEALANAKKKNRPVKLSCLKNRNGGQYDIYFVYHAVFDCFKPTTFEMIKDNDDKLPNKRTRDSRVH